MPWFDPSYDDPKYWLFGLDFYQHVVKLWTETYRAEFEQARWLRAPQSLWDETLDITYVQKITIPDSATIAFIGDIHSSFHSLLDILEALRDGFVGDTLDLQADRYLIFLGDLVDRGPYSLEILMLVYLLKIRNPKQVYVLNGNHEDASVYEDYGLTDEAMEQLDGLKKVSSLKYLATAIYMKYRGHLYHLSHGAFDPNYADDGLLQFLQSDSSHDTLDEYDLGNPINDLNQYKWGDFHMSDQGYFPTQDRHIFGTQFVQDYLQKFGITCMITGHQDQVNFALMPSPTIPAETQKLLQPSGIYRGSLYELKPQEVVDLVPGRDMLALVTSTATVSKYLTNNCYLIMK